VSAERERFVGLQMSPVNFLDEGVEPLLDMLRDRFAVNAIMIGTVSWLGLKVGRRVSRALEGWPDHGHQDETPLRGGSYLAPRPAQYERTSLKQFRAPDEVFAGIDVLDLVLAPAAERGIRVYADLMEPMFNYLGHGSSQRVELPGLAQVMQVDCLGRIAAEPCLNHPDYRNWLWSVVEDHASNYAGLAGIMWCNERRSPLDAALAGSAPHCFCSHCERLAAAEGVDVGRARTGLEAMWRLIGELRAGVAKVDGALIAFLRTLYAHPDILTFERFWVERNKALDRELYGIVKFCDRRLEFGLNVWNRNHLNLWRKAQWPWREQAQWADWVKPIVYQHQSGGIFFDEWSPLLGGVFRDLDPELVVELAKAVLGLDEVALGEMIATGFDPDTYVESQCRETVAALEGAIPVYMGIGVDAPRSRPEQAVCTPDIVRRSVLATFRAGGTGVIFGPAYSGMNLTTLDGAAEAFRELDRV